MRLLLDTHALLWWFTGDARLSLPARRAIDAEGADAHVSAASVWEITTKFRLGKLPVPQTLVANLEQMIDGEGFKALPITLRHGHLGGGLAGAHKDPFDRMLIAQAICENLALVSNESVFDSFGVARVW
jgi:PIN domain nuclease of toxin-antitoxin system